MHGSHWTGEAWNERNTGIGRRPAKEKTTVAILHNGDPTNSNVKVVLPDRVADVHKVPSETFPWFADEDVAEVNIPFEALEAFFLEHYRSMRIGQLEGATTEQLRSDLVHNPEFLERE